MHGYQDNGSPGVPGFAKRFVAAHIRRSTDTAESEIAHLPIRGIKPLLAIIPQACGAILNPKSVHVATMTKPGYPTPATQCRYLGVRHYPLPQNAENAFLFSLGDIRPQTKLLMLNLPHNPTGQIADREWWEQVCDYCSVMGIRLFNDAAYAALSYTPESSTLTDVAMDYAELSWAEAFSASKLIGNGTGWGIGATAGSPDFIGDIATIKGNTDSGFSAPMAAGVIHAVENDMAGINAVRELYARRLGILIESLIKCGMELAVEPKAGFFTLWEAPTRAFDRRIVDGRDFNQCMIENTGIAGVPFWRCIRYSVCGDIENMLPDIVAGFEAAEVSYR